jgi:amidase
MRDLKRITPVLNGANAAFDISCAPVPWRDVPVPKEKLTFGLLTYDGVVMPHPPVLRALNEAVDRLKAAGHEGIYHVPLSTTVS